MIYHENLPQQLHGFFTISMSGHERVKKASKLRLRRKIVGVFEILIGNMWQHFFKGSPGGSDPLLAA